MTLITPIVKGGSGASPREKNALSTSSKRRYGAFGAHSMEILMSTFATFCEDRNMFVFHMYSYSKLFSAGYYVQVIFDVWLLYGYHYFRFIGGFGAWPRKKCFISTLSERHSTRIDE